MGVRTSACYRGMDRGFPLWMTAETCCGRSAAHHVHAPSECHSVIRVFKLTGMEKGQVAVEVAFMLW